jgi:hypothetical protein
LTKFLSEGFDFATTTNSSSTLGRLDLAEFLCGRLQVTFEDAVLGHGLDELRKGFVGM